MLRPAEPEVAEHRHGLSEAFGAEEYEGQGPQPDHQDTAEDLSYGISGFEPDEFVENYKEDAVERTPGHEGPGSAVPQPAHEEHDEQVEHGARPAPPVAAKGDIQVIAKPRHERHVPAAPEVLERHGQIWFVEVAVQVEPEQFRGADRNLRIGGEVEIELEGEKDHGHEARKACCRSRIAVDTVHIYSEPVRYDHLLEKAGGNREEPFLGAVVIEGMKFVELGQEVFGPLDGARHQLREEGDEGEERHYVVVRLEAPVVDVQRIAQALEDVEADSDGQDDVQRGEGHVRPEQPQQVGEAVDEEVAVLEEGQHPEVHDQAQDQPELAFLLLLGAVDGLSAEIIHRRDEDYQEQELPVPAAVKDVAHNEQEPVPALDFLPEEKGVQEEGQRQENNE